MQKKFKRVRSPFRYPGAKTRILDKIIGSMEHHLQSTESFVDVFVGGGSVSLQVASMFPSIKEMYLNDLDIGIHCFWECLSKPKLMKQLCSIIEKTDASLDAFLSVKNSDNKKSSCVTNAFNAIFLNRTTFSGIMDAGPIGGMKQQSKWDVGCRYNQKALVGLIEKINSEVGPSINSMNMHFSDLIDTLDDGERVFYFDPPYYHKGNDLYRVKMSIDDHVLLSSMVRDMKSPWVMSYDYCDEIIEMYEWASINTIDMRTSINGKKDNWTEKKELIITKKEKKIKSVDFEQKSAIIQQKEKL